MLQYDGTVRNSRGHIVQFLYGEDGLDGCWIEGQNLNILTMSNTEFEREFQWTEREINQDDFGIEFLEPETIEVCSAAPPVNSTTLYFVFASECWVN